MDRIYKADFPHDGFPKSLMAVFVFYVFFHIQSCAPKIPITTPTQSTIHASVTELPPSAAPVILPSITPTYTRPAIAANTPIPPVQLCAPLPGYDYQRLAEAVSNPFHPPDVGSDDPHQGVDLAVEQFGMAIAGGPVQNILAGTVALVIRERFPYGNAVLVETSLENLPDEWVDELEIQEAVPTPRIHSALTCPYLEDMIFPPDSQLSIYVMYAHLEEIQPLQIDMPLECGDRIGTIGQSGNALNPHLHLEVRAGPTGKRFGSLAHYTTSASPEEMSQYCLWRISGIFELIDPMRLLENLP
jgi:murein DD-endopeptidase MepM/ murein hydrolase activator NlpD